MQLFARIDPANPGVVAEIIVIPANVAIDQCFTPAIVAQLVPCDHTVSQGMLWNGSAFLPAPAPPVPVILTPAQVATALLNDQQATSVVLRGLIVLLAQKFNTTQAAVINAIVNAAN